MLKIYHANKLEALLPHLAKELVDAPTDPFQAEVILVQNPGMAHWLKLQIASMFSVSANIEFPLPSTFIWRIFRQLLSELPERSAFVKESMVWKLMSLLPRHLDDEHFEPLKNYLQDDDDQRKRYQLAEKIADIFDQYLVYRPDWINAWQNGDDPSSAEQQGQRWQPLLWQALVAQTEQLSQSPYHRANLFEKTARKLAVEEAAIGDLPERLFIFGISTLAPNYLKVLEALSMQIDIHLMVFNPCMHFWGDVMNPKYQAKMQAIWLKHNLDSQNEAQNHLPNANPLLASMAQQGRDYLDLLHECDAIDVDAYLLEEPASLLQLIQRDILEMKNRGLALNGTLDHQVLLEALSSSAHKTAIAGEDQSIIVHNCYSAVREVEALHEQLLALFDEDPTLTPKDIVVMMANVDSYTPYIQAVFNSFGGRSAAGMGTSEGAYIPWSISDRSVKAESPVLVAFLSLLQLPASRFTVSEVFDLLMVPAISQRFEINEKEQQQLQHWVQKAGVRWGLDGQSKQQLELPADEQNSWSFGLKRMLLGYAMPQEQGVFAGVLPFDGVEGSSATVLGKLFSFIDSLEKSQQALRGERELQQWIELINTLLERFFLVLQDQSQQYALQSIRDQLASLSEQIESAAFEEPISHAVFVDILRAALQKQSGGQRFLAGQVNFCTLMPMRSIPFKVVCLLGMNDGVYPRTVEPLGFDLMAADFRKGDRSRRDDDRYLFLEALLSARQKLIISYQGRSDRDSSEWMPSVLVSELLEYCQQGFMLAGDEALPSKNSAKNLLDYLCVEHPLQPFNQCYFSSNEKHYSYSRHWLQAAEKLQQRTKALSQTLPQDNGRESEEFCPKALPAGEETAQDYLEIEQLIRFFRNPAQYFLTRRLGVYFYQDGEELIDDEPFELDALEKYHIKTQWLSHSQSGGQLDEFTEQQRLSGTLPLGMFATQSITHLVEGLSFMLERLEDYQGIEFQSRDVRLMLDDLVLAGRIDHLSKEGPLRYRPGRFKGADKISLWIHHLALCAMGDESIVSRFIAEDKVYRLQPLNADAATKQLQVLVDFYFQGQCKPLLFICETSFEAYNPKHQHKDKRIAAMSKAYQGVPFRSIPGDGDNPYINRCFKELSEWPEEIFSIATQVFTGFYEALEEEV